jgi:hypothetical protein
MTTIVKHRRTGNEYILLGINGEANKVNPSRFISELFNQEKSEISCSATVCDVQGNIFLAYIDDLIVKEIDGIKPAEVLPAATYEATAEPLSDNFADDFDEDAEEEDSDYDEEYEDELDTTEDAPNAFTAKTSVVDSLDAPSPDESSDDEDWI